MFREFRYPYNNAIKQCVTAAAADWQAIFVTATAKHIVGSKKKPAFLFPAFLRYRAQKRSIAIAMQALAQYCKRQQKTGLAVNFASLSTRL
jgi:hypothetical protein